MPPTTAAAAAACWPCCLLAMRLLIPGAVELRCCAAAAAAGYCCPRCAGLPRRAHWSANCLAQAAPACCLAMAAAAVGSSWPSVDAVRAPAGAPAEKLPGDMLERRRPGLLCCWRCGGRAPLLAAAPLADAASCGAAPLLPAAPPCVACSSARKRCCRDATWAASKISSLNQMSKMRSIAGRWSAGAAASSSASASSCGAKRGPACPKGEQGQRQLVSASGWCCCKALPSSPQLGCAALRAETWRVTAHSARRTILVSLAAPLLGLAQDGAQRIEQLEAVPAERLVERTRRKKARHISRGHAATRPAVSLGSNPAAGAAVGEHVGGMPSRQPTWA